MPFVSIHTAFLSCQPRPQAGLMAQVRLCLSQLGFPAPYSHVEAVWSFGNNAWGQRTLPNGLFFICLFSAIIQGMEVESDGQQPGKKIVRKPYVVNGQCCIWGSPKPLCIILSSCAVPGCYFLSRLVEERVFSKCLSLQPQEGSCHCEMCWCVGPE